MHCLWCPSVTRRSSPNLNKRSFFMLQHRSGKNTVRPHVQTCRRRAQTISGNIPKGFVNNTSWRPDLERPLLGLTGAQREANSWGEDQFVVRVGNGTRETVVDLIVNNLENGDHPFHLVFISVLILCKTKLTAFRVAAWSSLLSTATAWGPARLWILQRKVCSSVAQPRACT